jgi:hypothetical protein
MCVCLCRGVGDWGHVVKEVGSEVNEPEGGPY